MKITNECYILSTTEQFKIKYSNSERVYRNFHENSGCMPAATSRLNARTLIFGNRDFNLNDIILNLVNDIFIDAHFIRISMKSQFVLLCV